MEQNLKELLLKDLCARLPYGVKMTDGVDIYRLTSLFLYKYIEMELKPYLRPMPSMTPEEREEIEIFIFGEWFRRGECKVDGEGWIEILADYDVSGIDPGFCSDYVDWLNAHHFDYRNLIGLGLALEAPDDMYNLKEE